MKIPIKCECGLTTQIDVLLGDALEASMLSGMRAAFQETELAVAQAPDVSALREWVLQRLSQLPQ